MMNTVISIESSNTKKQFSRTAAATADNAALAEVYAFRPIQQSDRNRVKTLHEDWFPVV